MSKKKNKINEAVSIVMASVVLSEIFKALGINSGDNYKKKFHQLKMITVFLALLVVFLMFLFIMIKISSPQYYCEKWGGKLYQDNNCYLTADMDLCITPEGMIQRKMFHVNFTEFEELPTIKEIIFLFNESDKNS